MIEPGGTVEGTLYVEVRNMRPREVLTLDAQVYYPYSGFDDYAYYRQRINYNLN